jgi:hypothetical protein
MSELIGSVSIGLADVITDGISCAKLLHGDVRVPNDGYKQAYVVILCFGVAVTVLSLAYRLRNARLMQAQALELGQQAWGLSASATRRQAQQHEWELAQTHRTKVILSLALLSVATQGAMPLQAAGDARACMV